MPPLSACGHRALDGVVACCSSERTAGARPSAGWTAVPRRIEAVGPLFENLEPPLDVVPAAILHLTAQSRSGQSGPIAETVDQQFRLRKVVMLGEG